jgi:sucrose-6-phosphate hydrolase SacC (GH32 family)
MIQPLYPNEYGVAFSGCAVTDSQNVSGLGKDAIILYYTAFLEGTASFPESVSTIRRYYSKDHGKTFRHDPDFCIPQITSGNRDPKIFYHDESDSWIMVLFLEKHEFAILRSLDLNEWQAVQKFSLADAWECPDLFRLRDRTTVEITGFSGLLTVSIMLATSTGGLLPISAEKNNHL